MAEEGNVRPAAPQGPPPEGERRLATRQSSTLRIACYPAGSGLLERRMVRIRNVSRTGIGLIVDRNWHQGLVLILELPAEDGVRSARARIVHSTSQPGGTFLVGCVFDNPLTDAEVQALAR
ncbi:MAG: PilZ domain-containing protein [Planctomycetes bacterium]|nr:PilZ domain-containing protein [Planctomycetota bacterium]